MVAWCLVVLQKKISTVSELWKSSRSLGSQPVRGVFSTRGPDSSVDGVPVVNCPDVDHMEEEVQVSVQVEKEGIGETHGKEQREEQSQRTDNRTTWMTMEMRWRARADTWANVLCNTFFSTRIVHRRKWRAKCATDEATDRPRSVPPWIEEKGQGNCLNRARST